MFEACSTYLEENPLHKEIPCGMVGKVQAPKQRTNAYTLKKLKMTSDKWTYSKGKEVPSQICTYKLKEGHMKY